MVQIRYVLLLVCISFGMVSFAQKNERDYLRSGNKLYQDSLYVKAEVDYLKALDINPKSTEVLYNLGNSLMMQQKGNEAMERFDAASKIEKNKMKLAKIYHNMGVILQASKQYPLCIEAYKKALRNNPKDDETRYNLALAQKMLKDQQQQNNNQQNNKEDDKKNNEQDKDNKQQEQNKKEQDKQQEQNQPPQEQMSKENAQQLLNAVMQDEKEVQDKVKKQLQVKGKKFEKDW